jgi:hypothetical protein
MHSLKVRVGVPKYLNRMKYELSHSSAMTRRHNRSEWTWRMDGMRHRPAIRPNAVAL